MEYTFKEYSKMRVFDCRIYKGQQETKIIETILGILNNKVTLDEFIKSNPTLEDFKEKNKLNNVLKHWPENLSLNEEDYKKLLNNLKKITDLKTHTNTENIKKDNIGNKEYITYSSPTSLNKNIVLDNSNSKNGIEKEIKNLQNKDSSLQSTDPEKNTENALKKISEDTSRNITFQNLNEINIDRLTPYEQQIYKCAKDYQIQIGYPIKVNLGESIIMVNDQIKHLIFEDGKAVIKEDTNSTEKSNIVETTIEPPARQKQFTLNMNSNNS